VAVSGSLEAALLWVAFGRALRASPLQVAFRQPLGYSAYGWQFSGSRFSIDQSAENRYSMLPGVRNARFAPEGPITPLPPRTRPYGPQERPDSLRHGRTFVVAGSTTQAPLDRSWRCVVGGSGLFARFRTPKITSDQLIGSVFLPSRSGLSVFLLPLFCPLPKDLD